MSEFITLTLQKGHKITIRIDSIVIVEAEHSEPDPCMRGYAVKVPVEIQTSADGCIRVRETHDQIVEMLG